MRLTPSWIEEARRMLDAPVLERLRFFEKISPDPEISAAEICGALDLDDADVHGLAQCIGHLIPVGRFFEVLEGMEGMHAVMMPEHFRTFATAAALHDIETPASPFLRQALAALNREWHDGNRDAVLPAMPHLAALAEHANPDVAYAAGLLALAAKILPPAVVGVLRCRLRELPELLERRKAGDAEVGSLGRGELFWGIAKAGEALRELAPDFLLHEDNSLYAAIAAVGVNAPSLAPAMERLYQATPAAAPHLQHAEAFAIVRARSYYGYASWYLGGPDSRFDEAAVLVESHPIARLHWLELLRVSTPSQRVLPALLQLAKTPLWQQDMLGLFGGFGPAAASCVAAMPCPDMADKRYVSHVKASWRCGLQDATATRRAIEQKLASHDWNVVDENDSGLPEAWQLYLELDPDPRRIGTALATLDPMDIELLGRLAFPRLGLRFLPLIHQSGHDALVEALWRHCPDKSEFWAALKT